MPIYEFECLKCGYQFERLQKLSDPPVSRCPECGSKRVSQLLSAPAIQFKGTGWYVTDYARKSVGAGPAKEESNGKGGAPEAKSGEGTSAPSESKSSSGSNSKSST